MVILVILVIMEDGEDIEVMDMVLGHITVTDKELLTLEVYLLVIPMEMALLMPKMSQIL